MPSGKGGGHRNGAVVLTPARSTTGSAGSKGWGRDVAQNDAQVAANSKGRGFEKVDFECGRGGRSDGKVREESQANSIRGSNQNKNVSTWGHDKGETFAKGQGKSKTKHVSKAASDASQPPRVRDEIQEGVDEIVSMSSTLLRTDFDGRVFQYLHAIHGVGGQEKVRAALKTIHLSTLQKQRSGIKKWPAYLATLLKKSFDDLGAEKREERDRARIEAEAYGKQLSSSIDALFDKPVEITAANPQEADDQRASPQEWLKQAVTEEREQQWLQRGSNLLLSSVWNAESTVTPAMPQLSLAVKSIPPGFTPPQVASPTHALQHSGSEMLAPLPVGIFASTPPPKYLPPPLQPPPLPPPRAQLPSDHSSCKQPEPPRMISPPSAPTNGGQQRPHQPRVVTPPPRRQQSTQENTPSGAATPARPPPPPTEPPQHASGSQLLAEASWSTKSTPLLPPPWPAQYVCDA